MYGKIFESMYDGTIATDWKAMIVFQQFIVLCDSDGVIDMTPSAISRRTNIPLDLIESGIKFLSRPDESSRSNLHDGKRIILIDKNRSWGWEIVNHNYYRNLSSREDKREKDRERIAVKRAQVHEYNEVSQGVAQSRKQSRMSPMQDANTDKSKKMFDSNQSDVFDIFWRSYPRKESKKKAKILFNRLSTEKKNLAIKDSSTRYYDTDKKFIPLPTTYINGERWNDELSSQSDGIHPNLDPTTFGIK